MASLAALSAEEPIPDAAAGRSMGEVAALVAAGALAEADGLWLIARRADAMADAGERRGRSGSMLAVLGVRLRAPDALGPAARGATPKELRGRHTVQNVSPSAADYANSSVGVQVSFVVAPVSHRHHHLGASPQNSPPWQSDS